MNPPKLRFDAVNIGKLFTGCIVDGIMEYNGEYAQYWSRHFLPLVQQNAVSGIGGKNLFATCASMTKNLVPSQHYFLHPTSRSHEITLPCVAYSLFLSSEISMDEELNGFSVVLPFGSGTTVSGWVEDDIPISLKKLFKKAEDGWLIQPAPDNEKYGVANFKSSKNGIAKLKGL